VEYRRDSGGSVVEIRGPQLSLRPLCRGDLPILERWRKGESYRGTLIEPIFDMGVEEIFRHFNRSDHRFFLVRLKEGDPLGFLTYKMNWTDPTRGEMKKFLALQEHRGRGLGSQMTYLWLHYGFTQLHLRKISAKTVDSNLVNINLNRKLGFQFEGRLKGEVRLHDSFADVTVMSVLRDQVKDLFQLPQGPEAPK
jgi:RimJ/RimL family protein N-acetyltransferase